LNGTSADFSGILTTKLGNSGAALASNRIALFEGSGNSVVQINVPDNLAAGLFFGRSTNAYYAGIERFNGNLLLKVNDISALTLASTGAATFSSSVTAEGRLLVGTSTGVGDDFTSIRFNSAGTFTQGLNMVDSNASSNGGIFQVFRKSNDTYIGLIRRHSTDDAILVAGNSYLSLGANNTENVRITSAGNVNIGGNYTSTTNTLQVAGNVAIGYTTAAPTNGLIVNGDVGIGTTTPGAKLDISGIARVVSYSITVSGNSTGTITITSPTGTNMQGSMQVMAGGYGNSVTGNVIGSWLAAGLLFFDNANTTTIVELVNTVTANGSMSFQRSGVNYTVVLTNTSSEAKTFRVSVILNAI